MTKDFEEFAKRQGLPLLVTARGQRCENGWYPATYFCATTEAAWRAWENKPAEAVFPLARDSVRDALYKGGDQGLAFYRWLEVASHSKLPDVALAARTMMAYFEGAELDPTPADWSFMLHSQSWPDDLHRDSKRLVAGFAAAMACKLAATEKKYGLSTEWMDSGWMDKCRADLVHHVAKGDPRDVANYCAFLWWHGEQTSQAQETEDWPASPTLQNVRAEQEMETERMRAMLKPEVMKIRELILDDSFAASFKTSLQYRQNLVDFIDRCIVDEPEAAQPQVSDSDLKECFDAIDFSQMVTADDLFYMIARAVLKKFAFSQPAAQGAQVQDDDVMDARLFRKLLSYQYWHRQALVSADDIRKAINLAPNKYRDDAIAANQKGKAS